VYKFKKSKGAFEVRAQGESTKLLVYGPIGEYFGGVGITQIKNMIEEHNPTEIEIDMHSDGGSVAEGLGIYNLLKNSGARIIVNVDGVAMSIASIIMLAGDEVNVTPESMVMIHNPWAIVSVNANECDSVKAKLQARQDQMLNIYEDRMNFSRAEIQAFMDEEKEFNGQEIIEAGLATGMIEQSFKAAACLRSDGVPESFKNVTPTGNKMAASGLSSDERSKILADLKKFNQRRFIAARK